MKIDAGTKDLLILAAILGLVVLVFREQIADLAGGGIGGGTNPNPWTPGDGWTCYDGSVVAYETECASRGGIAPNECQGLTGAEFTRCMEKYPYE